jgi:AraC-like DNA-binding protein
MATTKHKRTPGGYENLSEDEILFILLHGLDNFAHGRGISQRTLRRRLARSGSRLVDRLEMTRRALATNLLATDISIHDLARRLGFASAQTFGRYFKREFGQTATKMRKNQWPPENALVPDTTHVSAKAT